MVKILTKKGLEMKIALFGLGAVSSVMMRVIFELFKKSDEKSLRFLLIIRDRSSIKKYFFKNREIINISKVLIVKDFNEIFQNIDKYSDYFKGIKLLVNSATPDFNEEIIKLANRLKINYADLASDIYNSETIDNLTFTQQKYDEAFKNNQTFGLINLGISPGITNFLIGERIYSFNTLPYLTKVQKIDIYLLEQMVSNQLIFSWSPNVAVDEISYTPYFFKNGKLKAIEPFSKSKTYKFPYYKNFVEEYPIFQEEVISLKQSFKDIEDIKMYVGGSEVELMKSLYQLNLFSSKHSFIYQNSELSINDIIKEVIPKMKTPKVIEGYMKDKTIKYAEFSAVAELTLEINYPEENRILKSKESIGITFNRYLDLINTPYSGSTYISYPTGVGAGILLFYTYLAHKKKKNIRGVILSENLPKLFGRLKNDIIKRELSSYKIDLINSIGGVK